MKLLPLVALFVATSAGADWTRADNVYVIGDGTSSCGHWIESRNNPVARQRLTQWVLGFVSGSNWRTAERQSNPVDSEAITSFVDLYCQNNPVHFISLAAAAAVQETGGPKAEHQWKR